MTLKLKLAITVCMTAAAVSTPVAAQPRGPAVGGSTRRLGMV